MAYLWGPQQELYELWSVQSRRLRIFEGQELYGVMDPDVWKLSWGEDISIWRQRPPAHPYYTILYIYIFLAIYMGSPESEAWLTRIRHRGINQLHACPSTLSMEPHQYHHHHCYGTSSTVGLIIIITRPGINQLHPLSVQMSKCPNVQMPKCPSYAAARFTQS